MIILQGGLLAAHGVKPPFEHLYFPYVLPPKMLCSSLMPIGPHSANQGTAMPSMYTWLRTLQPTLPSWLLAAWLHTLRALLVQSGRGEWSAVFHSLYIHPLQLQLVCRKRCLSECWAIASRGELGPWWLTGAALLTQAQSGDFLKNKFYTVQVTRKVDLMKRSSMNNTDILAHIKLAYKLSFEQTSLVSFEYDFIWRGNKCLDQDKIAMKVMYTCFFLMYIKAKKA